MNYYQKNINEVLSELKTSERGLSEEEAEERLFAFGRNELRSAKKASAVKRFLKQLADPMTVILVSAALVSFALTLYSNKASGEFDFPSDVIIIMSVVLINATLGVVQESKAEEAIEALQKMSSSTSKAIRNGKTVTIKSETLVAGDIVIIEAGDAVPADMRIIESVSIKAEESALTGESVPVIKRTNKLEGKEKVPLGDRKNMLYMGSTVVYGRGKGVVVATGMNTEMGSIASALTDTKDTKTPLQQKLSHLSKTLTILVIAICIVVFAVSLIKSGELSFAGVLDTFMIAVSLAVAAIPEGLATVVTIVLSIGVTNMSKKNAIIRKMTAVEALGCTQIICSDKTGTLTQNKMTVVKHFGTDKALSARAFALCSDADYDRDTHKITGEPTEAALLKFAEDAGIDKNKEERDARRAAELPFDSQRKMMTTIHKVSDNEYIQFTKGAPDVLIKKCSAYWENGREVPITQAKLTQIIYENNKMADEALRVLACAKKVYSALPKMSDANYIESGMCFVGLAGMIDPVRPEVKPAIDECKLAGIRPIMITGDHKDTAIAIALQLGIINNKSEAITGRELDELTDEEFDFAVEKYSVYARVQPEHKTRIVKAWQRKGKVTAMTGDGVNDAPSIKKADIGVGMGITGTDVTKNVSDIILADDNFATIVSAVGEGRRIFDNIRKAVQFLLASNLAEVLSIFAATMLGFTIFKAPHLLWINLITDCFPALALGMEKPESNIMRRKPRKSSEGIFSGGVGSAIAYQGFFVTAITLASYALGKFVLYERGNSAGLLLYDADDLGTTMAFMTLALCEICHSFNMRSVHGSIFALNTVNYWLWGAAAVSFAATTAVVEIPFLTASFCLARLKLTEYVIAFALALTIIPITEIIKFILRNKYKNN